MAKLSLCMIVKDAEDTIERVLQSACMLVDEIVVADTGSADGTLSVLEDWYERHELSRDMGEPFFEYYQIGWDGFANARNHSMDMATGDVILILDSDEYISEGHDLIRRAADDPNLVAGAIPVLNKVENGPIVGERIQQLRLFKNHPDIRYRHKIHNQIENQVHAYMKRLFEETGSRGGLVRVPAEIVHTGYDLDAEAVVAKYSPRIALLREEVRVAKDERDRAYFQFQLASMLYKLFSEDESLPMWEEIEYEHLIPPNRWYAHYVATVNNARVGDFERALHHVDGMFEAQDSPQVVPEAATHMMAGVCYLNLGERKKGLKFLMQAFLDNLTPSFGTRCILNGRKLINDIAMQYDTVERQLLMEETDLVQVVKYIRELQRDLEELPQEILEVL